MPSERTVECIEVNKALGMVKSLKVVRIVADSRRARSGIAPSHATVDADIEPGPGEVPGFGGEAVQFLAETQTAAEGALVT